MSIVTLLWRNERWAEGFVGSLLRSVATAGVAVELILVVNGPDGVEAKAAVRRIIEMAQAPSLTLIELDLPENLGFAGGANAGLSRARGAIVNLLNFDVQVDAQYVSRLAARGGAVSPAMFVPSVRRLSVDGEPDFTSREAGPLRRTFIHRGLPFRTPPQPGARVEHANGSSIVATASFWEARRRLCGEFLPGFFHSYSEDLDLFWWASRLGFPISFEPDLKVFHVMGGSFGGDATYALRPSQMRVQVLANWRMAVFRNHPTLRETMGWIAGEGGYVLRLLTHRPWCAPRDYLLSWVRTVSFGFGRGSIRSVGRPVIRLSVEEAEQW